MITIQLQWQWSELKLVAIHGEKHVIILLNKRDGSTTGKQQTVSRYYQ